MNECKILIEFTRCSFNVSIDEITDNIINKSLEFCDGKPLIHIRQKIEGGIPLIMCTICG